MDFTGRKTELSLLERLYHSGKFECVVIYGRRRVGKSELIRQFVKGKRALLYLGHEGDAQDQLNDFNRELSIFEDEPELSGESWPSLKAAFRHLFRLAENERLILALDEYPFMVHSVKGLSSLLQNLIDEFAPPSKLMLILCGSSISMMEEETLAYKAPLYGRTTCRINLQPLEFKDVLRCFPDSSPEDAATAFGILGGTPYYLQLFANGLSLKENIISAFLMPGGQLTDAPAAMLQTELATPERYQSVLRAIAGGASRLNEIATRIHAASSNATHLLNNLIKLRLVYRETPYLEENSKKTIYGIDDQLLRFWYTFILPNIVAVNNGSGPQRYPQITQGLSDYMGSVFERICLQYLWYLQSCGRLPVACGSMGRWWGNFPQERTQVEIDIMGQEDKHKALFAECKWRNELTDLPVLNQLQQRSSLFHHEEKHYFIFSKSGFTPRCQEAAALPYVHLISFSQMCEDLLQA